MSDDKQKNRRYRGAKLSEYRLRKIVEGFAQNKTVKETAEATRFSENTVADIFMRIRERLFQYGFMRVQRDPSKPVTSPARIVFQKKHRGVSEKHLLLYEAEFLHRVMLAQNTKGFQELKASSPEDLKRATTLDRYNTTQKRYRLIEIRPSRKSPDGKEQREFDPTDVGDRSKILVNERRLDPHAAFFNYIWQLLLQYPL